MYRCICYIYVSSLLPIFAFMCLLCCLFLHLCVCLVAYLCVCVSGIEAPSVQGGETLVAVVSHLFHLSEIHGVD